METMTNREVELFVTAGFRQTNNERYWETVTELKRESDYACTVSRCVEGAVAVRHFTGGYVQLVRVVIDHEVKCYVRG